MKIDIQKIVAKHNQMFWLERTPESLPMIKEIVELVISICADEVKTKFVQVDTWIEKRVVDKQSIINVKKQIKYE